MLIKFLKLENCFVKSIFNNAYEKKIVKKKYRKLLSKFIKAVLKLKFFTNFHSDFLSLKIQVIDATD